MKKTPHNYRIIELYNKYHNSITKQNYMECLSEIKSEKEHTDRNSINYLNLLHLECITRQRIYEVGPCPFDKIIPNLNKAFECTTEIQKICEELQDHHLMSLVSMQEATCILTELSRFDEPIEYLNEIVKIHEFIRNCRYADNELIYLSYMNEAKVRLELAKNNVTTKKNCKLSLELSEKAREYYEESYPDYNITFQNQVHALSILSKIESYNFEIEIKEAIKKLNNKINKPLNLYNLQIDAKLVELGIEPPTKLDEIIKCIPIVKKQLCPEENLYKQSIIFEGEILIKKAEFSHDIWDKIMYLNQSIDYFNNNLAFDDKFYIVQSLFNIGYAKLQLSNLIGKEKNLNDALTHFLACIEFYENTPFQNNEYFYPITALYLSKTGKKLALMQNNLIEKNKIIKETLLLCLEIFKETRNKEKIIDTYLELGDLFYKIENYEEAYYYLNKAINIVEIMRASIFDLNLKKNFFKKTSKLFELMIEICYYLDKKEELLKFVELSRNRIFLDKISESQRYKFIKTMPKEMIYELNNINLKIESSLDKIKNCDKIQFKISSNYEKLSKLKNQQEYYLNKIKTDFQDYYNYHYNYFFDYTELDLKTKTLIEYYYTKEMLLICLIENEKIIIKHVDLKNTNLLGLINEFKENIKKSMDDNEYEHALDEITKIMEQLYNILIKPIESEISNNDLLIIPYKELHNIPFYCLKKNNKYLIDAYTITIAQSGTSIKYLENNAKKSNNESLVIGIEDEELSHTIKEAKFISEKLGTKPLLNENVTKENVLNSIEGKSIIHFAGHGCYNPKNPLESHLKLFDENLLIKDIENKNIDSELITLSACETGIVSADETDDTTSFITSLHLDGVKYIIASLWPVFDDSTMKIFKYFYDSTE